MKKWCHKLEKIVDRIIPLLLVILLIIIILEFTLHKITEKYHLFIQIFDYFLITVFLIDLIFKYNRIRNIPRFLKESWLDIIAIFPFFILFRFFEGLIGILGISETTAQAQKILHIGVGVEKEIEVTLKEGSRIAEETSRAEKLTKYLIPITRSIRLLLFKDKDVRKDIKKDEKIIKGTVFYEKPQMIKQHLLIKTNINKK